MKYIPYLKSINKAKNEILKLVKNNLKGMVKMKFIKGIVIGGLITTGVMMMWSDNMMNTKKIAKRGKQMAKKMGIM